MLGDMPVEDRVEEVKKEEEPEEPEEEPEPLPVEEDPKLKVGNIFEYLKGSTRGRIKRHKHKKV